MQLIVHSFFKETSKERTMTLLTQTNETCVVHLIY